MGRLDRKVAFVAGAARGVGRSLSTRLAEEGADIIAIDMCGQVDSVAYRMATPDDLSQTVSQVEARGRRVIAARVDVRDLGLLRSRFVQPMGFFAGTLRFRGRELAVTELPGVTEDQDMLW